jgi:CubicO group peptidase (beta-lactamase class C family)
MGDLTRVGVDRGKLDDLLGRARVEIDRGILPACQLALAKDGELVAFETYGDATNDTRFAIFSQTKAFICSVMWMLLGEGSVSTDRVVADLVPGFGATGKDAITLEHVLSHGAGFPSAFLNPYIWDDVDRRREAFASWPLDWEPGTRFEYHALSGHWVLCDIIETLTGSGFREVLRQRVIEPLGLKTFVLGGKQAAGPIAPLVIVGEPRPELEPPQHHHLMALADPGLREVGIPAGGGVSTAADVAMFYQALLHNRDEMWHEPTLRDATSNIRNAHPDPGRGVPMNYGLGVRIAGDDGMAASLRGLADGPRVFGHDGAGGQIAWADPDSGLSFCYLTNGLDDDLLRQGKRFAGISNRALACGSQPPTARSS